MHPAIQMLSDKLGVAIIDRDAKATWAYDGKTIANHYINQWEEDQLYPNTKGCARKIVYLDIALLHELGHFLAAKEEQKEFPEYGLAMGIAEGSGYGPKGGEFLAT